MWNPPIALTSEEQKIAVRTRKTRKFFVFLREHRHELLDADFQHMLAQSYSPEPSGQEPSAERTGPPRTCDRVRRLKEPHRRDR